ncbi:TerD family protein [Streptomyces sp. NPDC001401]|uniref:TerD family protein n=1 Tax=Streptomyces sp. NPDC001401 TaxID=3364570 RepID=UPI00367473D0
MAGRGGRPWGPIRAESAEAKTLAVFLRAQVDASGKTLTTLAGEIHLSKSRISEHLAGKLPDQDFISTLIRATIPEPRMCERRLAEAEKLLRAAAHPSPVTPPPAAAFALELAEARAQQVEIYDRLTRSLEQQNELREAAGNSARLVMVLLSMINKLERRIIGLTGERDQLYAQHADPDTLRQTQQQLARAQEQEQRAQQELHRAQEKQRQAEELAARVQAQVDQLRDELDRLHTSMADDTTANGYDTAVLEPAHHAMTTDPVGDDIDQALARVVAVNDRDDQVLQRINHDLIQAPPADEVVQHNPPNNPTSGPITADNLTPATRHEPARRRERTGDKPTRTRARSGSTGSDDASVGTSASSSFGTLLPATMLPVLVSFGGTVPTTGLHGVQGLTAAVIVLNGKGKVLSEDYVLHLEHRKTEDGSVALFSDREKWTHDLPREQGRHLAVVDFKQMPTKASRILFIVSVSAGVSRMGASQLLSHAYAEVFDSATMRGLAHFALSQPIDGYAAIIADLRRDTTGWRFQAVAQSGNSARAIAGSYGARSFPHSMWF